MRFPNLIYFFCILYFIRVSSSKRQSQKQNDFYKFKNKIAKVRQNVRKETLAKLKKAATEVKQDQPRPRNEGICGKSIAHRFVRNMYVSGGVTKECQPHHVSYESCKQLLWQEPECNAAYYHSKVCHLLARNRTEVPLLSRAKEVPDENAVGLLMFKLTHELDDCNSNATSSAMSTANPPSAIESLKACNAQPSQYNITRDDFFSLPRVNIVVSATENWVEANPSEFKKVKEHWKCYADVHNYLFTLNLLPPMPAADFFVSRHKYVQNRELRRAQYTLHLDADSLVLNMSRSLEPFLQTNASVILQFRENYEVTSAIYIVRNDHRSRCFLDFWRRFHPPKTSKRHGARIIPVPNNCNGALVAAVLYLSVPARKIVSCLKMEQATQLGPEALYPPGFKIESSFRSTEEMSNWLANRSTSAEERKTVLRVHYPFISPYPEHACMMKLSDKAYELGTSLDRNRDQHGVYVLWTQEGLWRTHEAAHTKEGWFIDRFRRCYPSSDLIGHGNKKIATELYQVSHGASCDIKASRLGDGANQQCRWLSSPQNYRVLNSTFVSELEVLRRTCAFNSPLCLTNITMKASDLPAGSDRRHVGSLWNRCGLYDGSNTAEIGKSWNTKCTDNRMELLAKQQYRLQLKQLDFWL